MRFLPKSLSGQLVLIPLLTLLAAQGISLILFAGGGGRRSGIFIARTLSPEPLAL